MMQQSICQQDQLGNQQSVSQQMVLCPVKLVYDTQILVQPGDQIQPNQTIFINPQNPPPWVQNRVQNQVIYVQQVPNHIIPNYQHIDPNSVFIQNYPYQIQQQILAQSPHEQRPMQITSLPQNMIHGLANVQNINIQNIQNERQQINNFGQIPQQIVANRQGAPNVTQVQNTIPQQNIEVQRPGYMNIRSQMSVGTNIRQQIINTSNASNTQNIRQTFVPVANQQRPIQIPKNTANIHRMIQPTFSLPSNSPQMQIQGKVLESTNDNNPANKTTTPNIPNMRSLPPSNIYRPIQPRPQYRRSLPIQQIQNIPSTSFNRSIDNRIISNPNIPALNITQIVNKSETQINRKRKSESPDEIQKKVSIINPIMTNNIAQKQSNISINNITVPNELSITRSENKILNQNTMLQLSNNGAQIVKLVDNGQQTNLIELPVAKPNPKQTLSNDKEKLVRNTVFTQARGRLINDKEIVPNNLNTIDVKPVEHLEKIKNEMEKVPDAKEIETTATVNSNNLGKLKNQQEELNKSGQKKEDNNASKEVQPNSAINSCQQILTHVLDGYVIQESNMAFPIRKPLREKIIYDNTLKEDTETKDVKEESTVKTKEETIKENKQEDLPQIPLHNLNLENDDSDTRKEAFKDNPFSTLQPATVKSWTVDQLAKHLQKYDWNETVSILQEHEIDGESLFLVSKLQLVQIGISEEHSDVICEFVKH